MPTTGVPTLLMTSGARDATTEFPHPHFVPCGTVLSLAAGAEDMESQCPSHSGVPDLRPAIRRHSQRSKSAPSQ